MIAEIISSDPIDPKKFSRNIVPIIGYDKNNIIIHDYLANVKERHVKNRLFMVAWKNAKYRMLQIEHA